MDDANSLPNDPTECHALLLAAFQQAKQLEQRAAEAERRAAESEQRVAELGRVLDETAASHEELKQTLAATLDELAWYKRWAFGRRRERFTEGKGQGHLFELDFPSTDDSEEKGSFKGYFWTYIGDDQSKRQQSRSGLRVTDARRCISFERVTPTNAAKEEWPRCVGHIEL